MKNYLCAVANGATTSMLLVIDLQSRQTAAKVDLSASAFTDAVTPLAGEVVGPYPVPVQKESPPYVQIGLTADYYPIFLTSLMATADGDANTTFGVTLYAVKADGFETYLTYTKTFPTPTSVTNQAMFLGSDGKVAYMSFPSDDGTTHRIVSLGIDGTATEQTSPLTSLPSVAAGALSDGTTTFLAFGTVNGSTTGAELWTLAGTAWERTQHSLTAWDSATVYPVSIPLAMASAAGITPAWFAGRVVPAIVGNNAGSQQPQCYDSNGAYKLSGSEVSDSYTSAILFNVQSLLAAAGSDVTTLSDMYQNFLYMDEFALPFWQNLVECDEVAS